MKTIVFTRVCQITAQMSLRNMWYHYHSLNSEIFLKQILRFIETFLTNLVLSEHIGVSLLATNELLFAIRRFLSSCIIIGRAFVTFSPRRKFRLVDTLTRMSCFKVSTIVDKVTQLLLIRAFLIHLGNLFAKRVPGSHM